MIDDTILVNYDPFAMRSTISFSDGRGWVSVHSENTKLADDLIKIAYQNDIYSIKIYAPSAIVAKIKRDIEQSEKDHYWHNKISIGAMQ